VGLVGFLHFHPPQCPPPDLAGVKGYFPEFFVPSVYTWPSLELVPRFSCLLKNILNPLSSLSNPLTLGIMRSLRASRYTYESSNTFPNPLSPRGEPETVEVVVHKKTNNCSESVIISHSKATTSTGIRRQLGSPQKIYKILKMSLQRRLFRHVQIQQGYFGHFSKIGVIMLDQILPQCIWICKVYI